MNDVILTGNCVTLPGSTCVIAELRQMSDGALLRRVEAIDVFVEIEPNQKERIIIAMRSRNHYFTRGLRSDQKV